MIIRQSGEMSWRQLGTRKSASGLKVEQTNNKKNPAKIIIIIKAVSSSTLLLTGKGLSQESPRMYLLCICPQEEPEQWLVLFNFFVSVLFQSQCPDTLLALSALKQKCLENVCKSV